MVEILKFPLSAGCTIDGYTAGSYGLAELSKEVCVCVHTHTLLHTQGAKPVILRIPAPSSWSNGQLYLLENNSK